MISRLPNETEDAALDDASLVYEPPKVTALGHVSELLAGMNSGTNLDANMTCTARAGGSCGD